MLNPSQCPQVLDFGDRYASRSELMDSSTHSAELFPSAKKPAGDGFPEVCTSFNTLPEISSHLSGPGEDPGSAEDLLLAYRAKIYSCKNHFRYVNCFHCETLHARPTWCRDRFCPNCAPRLGEWGKKLIEILVRERGLDSKKNKLKFLTFTCENFPLERVGEGLDILNKAFARMVRRKNKVDRKTGKVERQGWQNVFVGWMKRHEVTKGEDGNYHLHIHVLAEGKYFSQAQLADAWEDCLAKEKWYGRVCDIRVVKGVRGALKEIAKYCFKPLEMNELALACLSKVFKNRRLYGFGGAWYATFKGFSRRDLMEMYNGMNGLVDSMVFACVCGSRSFIFKNIVKDEITKSFLSENPGKYKWRPYRGGYILDLPPDVSRSE